MKRYKLFAKILSLILGKTNKYTELSNNIACTEEIEVRTLRFLTGREFTTTILKESKK